MAYLIASLLPILIFSLSIPTLVISQDSSLLNKVCSNNSQNYKPDNSFGKNLKYVFSNLYDLTPKNHGFSKATSGKGPDLVHGLALCRGDVSPDDCDYCIYDAKCKITNHCTKQTAMVWYDNCQLKYSDKDFFGKIDKENNFVMVNVENVTESRTKMFQSSSIGLLKNLSKQATDDTTNKYMFAGGETSFVDDQKKNVTIYGMAQCTRDLSCEDCKKCLDGAVKQLPIYNGTTYRIGARVVGASCTVRYETYTFLNSYSSV